MPSGSRFTAAFRQSLPALDKAIATAGKVAEKKRQEYLVADKALRVARTARSSAVVAYDGGCNRINQVLRTSAPAEIDAFQYDMRERADAARKTNIQSHHELDTNAAVRRHFSNLPGVHRVQRAIRDARAGAEALREEACEDVPAALAGLRDAIPAVGAPLKSCTRRR